MAEVRFSYLVTTTVSSKGQIVLPKMVRERRSIRTGDDLEVIIPEGSDDIVLRKVSRKPNDGLMEALRKLRGLKIPRRSGKPPRDFTL
jgi:AbrB family looped-hinge helix DNA binding protein